MGNNLSAYKYVLQKQDLKYNKDFNKNYKKFKNNNIQNKLLFYARKKSTNPYTKHRVRSQIKHQINRIKKYKELKHRELKHRELKHRELKDKELLEKDNLQHKTRSRSYSSIYFSNTNIFPQNRPRQNSWHAGVSYTRGSIIPLNNNNNNNNKIINNLKTKVSLLETELNYNKNELTNVSMDLIHSELHKMQIIDNYNKKFIKLNKQKWKAWNAYLKVKHPYIIK